MAVINIPYLIAKTVSYFPYIPNDIDILVPPLKYRETVSVLTELQSKYGKHQKLKDGCDQFESPEFYKADLHHRFTWLNAQEKQFIDHVLAWENIRYAEFFDIPCPIPNNTVEWMLNALNIMFERFHFPLNTYLTLVYDYKSINKNLVSQQASLYCWSGALERFLVNINLLNQAMNSEMIQIQGNGKVISPDHISYISFPHLYPYIDIIRAYLEQLLRRGLFDLEETLYNLTYARFKSLLSSKERVSMYGDWYLFNREKGVKKRLTLY